MKQVTFVCCPKPFLPEFEIVQTNALLSWKNLKITKNVVVTGNDAGVKEFCEKHNLIHEPNVEVNEWNTPLISSIFDLGYKHVDDDEPICYVNSDIILTDDFSDSVNAIFDNCKNDTYLIVGQRYDCPEIVEIDFNDVEWQDNIVKHAIGCGELHSICGVDYFLHTKKTNLNIYPWAVGKLHYDRWFIYEALRNRILTIDISKTAIAIHQESRRYQSGKSINNPSDVAYTEEGMRNRFGFVDCNKTGRNIDDCQYFSYKENGRIMFKRRF